MTHKNELQFFVGQLENNKFVAISNSEPYFCIEGKTEKEAVQFALDGWAAYLTFLGKDHHKPKVKKKQAWKSIERHFTANQIVFAEAC